MKKIHATKQFRKSFYVFVCLGGLFFLSLSFAKAQDLPEKIRDYKVYQAKISVKNQGEKANVNDDSEAFVKIGEPKVAGVSPNGITLEISAEIESPGQSGLIDFLTFRDFRVNDLAVEPEEYTQSFELKKNQSVVLPKPVKVFISVGQSLRGVLSELKESKDEWTITGRVFVFGRFKKSFLKFKRVVPIEINLKIKNPLRKV